MKNNKLLILLLLLFAYQQASALIINVPGNYATIKLALNASANGDTILVEPGTYQENIDFRGKKIVLTSRFFLNNDLNYINSTIIDGSAPIYADTGSVVVFRSGEDTTCVLQGFTITGGSGTKWTDEHGAGIYREGGGILVAFSSPVIRFNKIIGNVVMNTSGVTSTGGGGLRIGDGYPRVLNNIILYNKAKYGAGIVLNYTGCFIKNNIICYNTESSQYNSGAGIWANSNRANTFKFIENNTIIHNSGTAGTGGVLAAWNAVLYLKNNIIWGNSPTQVLAAGGGALNISYCDVENGYAGTGNISSYPLFADSNYVLADNSPCIDAGDSASVFNDPPDAGNPGYAKFPSRGTLRNDMGAYGGPLSKLLSSSQVIRIKQTESGNPEGYELSGNYPNPFNPSTKVKFKVPKSALVRLNVYDTSGKLIRTLINDRVTPGVYEIIWDAADCSSGNYFVRMEADNYLKSIIVTLIK